MSEKITDLRQRIDCIDDQILLLLRQRVELMEKIGEIKKQSSLSIRDDERERDKLKTIEQKAEKLGLPATLVTQLWTAFFIHSEEIEK
jgi:chorismate mutase/prephenate dehydrogenase